MFQIIRFWLKSGSIACCKIVNRISFCFMLSSKHMTCLYRLTIERLNMIRESPALFIWEVHYFTINVFLYYIILSCWSDWLWISSIAEFVHNYLLHYCRTKVKNRGFHPCYCLGFLFFSQPLRHWASAVPVHFSAHASLDPLRANASGFLSQTTYLSLTHGWISSSGLSNESLLSLEWRMQHAKGNSWRWWFSLAQMLSYLRRPDYQCGLWDFLEGGKIDRNKTNVVCKMNMYSVAQVIWRNFEEFIFR